jgi:LysM repeat protein
MKKYILYCLAVVLLTAVKAGAQDPGYTERAKKYIEQYAPYAIAEQKRAGVPASITLGQGILETEAGASELMVQANNHFGIKCKNGWTGETFLHDDDAPGECFKKYKCAEDSYKDHSDHLMRNPRYSPLFSIPQKDYTGWAVGLKKCGYATNPQYAQRLINIIENFGLQEYTLAGMENSAVPVSYEEKLVVQADPLEDTMKKPPVQADTMITVEKHEGITTIQKLADSARQVITQPNEAPVQAAEPEHNSDSAFANSKILVVNGLKAFYAYKNDMLLQYAVKYNVRYPKLLEMNDLPDGPLPFDTYVYIEKKRGIGAHVSHEVKPGESLLMISQLEGIQLKRLMALNMILPREEPVAGAVLQLQTMATHKPQVTQSGMAAHTGNAIANGSDSPGNDADYIATGKKPAEEPKHTTARPVKKTPPVVVARPAPPVKPVLTPKVVTDTAAATTEDGEAPKQEDLSGLKAELDKVVYADDSKLIAENKPAAEPAVVNKNRTYTVKKGDTSFSIAKKNGITIAQLMKWNSMYGGDVKVGQVLRVKE